MRLRPSSAHFGLGAGDPMRRYERQRPPRSARTDHERPFHPLLWRIDVDAAENYLVAGSPAKAAAVWSIRAVRRPPNSCACRCARRRYPSRSRHRHSPTANAFQRPIPRCARATTRVSLPAPPRSTSSKTHCRAHREGDHVRRRGARPQALPLLAGRDPARRHLE